MASKDYIFQISFFESKNIENDVKPNFKTQFLSIFNGTLNISNIPFSFQSLMDIVFSGLQGTELLVNLDNIVFYAYDKFFGIRGKTILQ